MEMVICNRGKKYEVTVKRKYFGRYDNLEDAIKVRDEEIRRRYETSNRV